MVTEPDPRLHAWREDLADIRLRGRVPSARFVEGRPAMVAVPVASVHRRPQRGAPVDTQLLFGDRLKILDRDGDWCWIQSDHDSYTGYVAAGCLSENLLTPTHLVAAARTFVYPEPELRTPPMTALSMGSRLAVTGVTERRGTCYCELATGGHVFAGHLVEAGFRLADHVEAAERLIGTPYLWGGTSAFGIDCSGLVQLSLRMAGRSVLRDSDMQEASLGIAPGDDEPVRRGDFLFWPGHVAIAAADDRLLHANGYTMQVSLEPMAEALARIAGKYGPPRGRRRLEE